MAAKKFVFSQYSTTDATVDVVIRGIPFKLRRALGIGERQKAQDKAISLTFDNQGQPIIGKPNTTAFTVEICSMAIKEWPFENEDGTPTPLTRANIAALDPALQDEISARVLGYYKAVEEEADPFEKKSEED